MLVVGLHQDLEAALLFELRPLILLAQLKSLLLLKLPVTLQTTGRQRAGLDRRRDRTPGLCRVPAIAEPACLGERVDIAERARERIPRIPQLQLPHPGRVDENTVVAEQHQLAVRARVAPTAVAFADFTRP